MFMNNFNDNIKKCVWTLKNYIHSKESKTLIFIYFFIVRFVLFFLT